MNTLFVWKERLFALRWLLPIDHTKLYRQARQQKGSNNKNFPC